MLTALTIYDQRKQKNQVKYMQIQDWYTHLVTSSAWTSMIKPKLLKLKIQ